MKKKKLYCTVFNVPATGMEHNKSHTLAPASKRDRRAYLFLYKKYMESFLNSNKNNKMTFGRLRGV